MKEPKILIHIDTLGFDDLPKTISKEKGIDAREIRKKFLNIIDDRIDEWDSKGFIKGRNIGERDDRLLVVDNIDFCFNRTLRVI